MGPGIVAPGLGVHQDTLEDAQAHEDATRGGGPGGDEGERDPGHGQQADVHPHVDEGLEQQHAVAPTASRRPKASRERVATRRQRQKRSP